MKRYEAYKDSGVEWIGEIPEGWNVVPLKHYLSLKGRIGWNGLKSEEFQEESYAYLVTGQDFNSDVVDWSKCYQINKDRYEEDPFIQLSDGDLLVTKDGTIGKVAKVVGLDKPACLNSGIFVVKQTKGVFEQGYLYWVLTSNQLNEFVGFNSTGSTIQHLYQNVFENMPLTIPPLPEQRAIATYLDHKVGKIDASVSAIDKQIDDLKVYRQSIISEAVTKGLDPNAKMKDSGVEWIGEIPEGWRTNRMKFFFSFGRGLNITKADLTEVGIPVISYGQIHSKQNTGTAVQDCLLRYVSVQVSENHQECKTKVGDFIFADTSEDKEGCGNCVYIDRDGIFAGYHAIVLDGRGQDNKYFSYLFKSDEWRSQIRSKTSGVKVFSITQSILSDCSLLIPSLPEQHAIASYLDAKTSKIASAITSLEQQRSDLEAMKQSVISEAVTGKIDVRQWNEQNEEQ